MNTTVPITLEIEPKTANLYQNISSDERKKLQYLFSLLVNEHKHLPNFLELLMDTISLHAQQRGLTPGILNQLLEDE